MPGQKIPASKKYRGAGKALMHALANITKVSGEFCMVPPMFEFQQQILDNLTKGRQLNSPGSDSL